MRRRPLAAQERDPLRLPAQPLLPRQQSRAGNRVCRGSPAVAAPASISALTSTTVALADRSARHPSPVSKAPADVRESLATPARAFALTWAPIPLTAAPAATSVGRD